jgi:hypothetical protein
MALEEAEASTVASFSRIIHYTVKEASLVSLYTPKIVSKSHTHHLGRLAFLNVGKENRHAVSYLC